MDLSLNSPMIDQLINLALAEDISGGDITTESTIGALQQGIGTIITKNVGIIAGLPVVERVLCRIDPDLDFHQLVSDGTMVEPMTPVAKVTGCAKSILTGERTALNFLQRLSGTATLTAEYVDAVKNTKTKIVDTRKTTPGWRLLQKYAVRIGGGKNHRFGLYDGILIKDNHIVAAGGIRKAVEMARSGAPHTAKIEIEVETIDQVEEALKTKADILLLDNMSNETMQAAVKKVNGNAITEASGGITLDRIPTISKIGVNFISVGALTHSAMPLDMSLDLQMNHATKT